jgi:hypothetical protein
MTQKKVPHNNKKYTSEQVHRMRYEKEDCHKQFETIFQHWNYWYSLPGEKRESLDCLNSRYYRDNIIPALTSDGELVYGKSGKVVWVDHKVRDRSTVEGKDIPFTLVEKHPVWCLVYPWVSPEHKLAAQKVIDEVNSGRMLDSKLFPLAG